MNVTVKLFARAKDLAGAETVEVELPVNATIGDLRTQLRERFPNLATLAPALLFAQGTDYADDGTPIDPQAELACFPPVSGG